MSGAAVAVALHAVALVVLLQLEPVRSALSSAPPLMVSWITPPKPVEPPRETPRSVPPRPAQRPKTVTPPPLLATTREDTASPIAAPPVIAPPPEPQKPVVAEAPVAPPAPPAPAPVVIPPSFNAAYLQNPPPEYPPVARRLRQQGKVTLRVHVSEGGAADRVEVRGSSGSPLLDNAALDAVKRWRFVPARQGDHAVSAWVLVPITFSLEG